MASPPVGWKDMLGYSNQVCGGALACLALDTFEAKGLTPRQARRVAVNSRLEPAARGERLDTFFKQSVLSDPRLQNLVVTPRFRFGPDVIDPVTGRWYDVTTPGHWPAHLKYGPGGVPLLY